MLRKLFTANSTTPLLPLLGNARQTGRKSRSNWAKSPELQKKRTNTSATPDTSLFSTQSTRKRRI
jgi:hypothetical protein